MGRAPCCDKNKVKRGPWSPEEDSTLKNYVEKYGTGGNWIALPHKAGLKRCGKSCRLRWLNYLRPDIKHGGFTEEEDDIILTLYTNIGSRWSIIASHLPGRTDNDVKNYWNTKLKKKLLAGSAKSLNATPFINNATSTNFTANSMDFGLGTTSIVPFREVQADYYGNSSPNPIVNSSDTLAYNSMDLINSYPEFIPEMVYESNHLSLPRLIEVHQENCTTNDYNGFTASSSQEISSLSLSYSLAKSYASWSDNGIGEEVGLPSYAVLNGFDTQDDQDKLSTEEANKISLNYSYSSSSLANISDSQPSQGLHPSICN